MKNYTLLLLVVVSSIQCNLRTSTGISDQSVTVRGTVLNSRTLQPVNGVIVGWKVHTFPDSILFKNGVVVPESLGIGYNVKAIADTLASGGFVFQAFLMPMPPYPYEDMFAFKAGYLLWRFDSTRDNPVSISPLTDSLTIQLNPYLR